MLVFNQGICVSFLHNLQQNKKMQKTVQKPEVDKAVRDFAKNQDCDVLLVFVSLQKRQKKFANGEKVVDDLIGKIPNTVNIKLSNR